MSDAGTPLLSDPGYRIVRGGAQAGIEVEALPGASACWRGWWSPGLPTDQFHFARLPACETGPAQPAAGIAGG